MAFMTITLRAFKRQHNSDYTILGATLLVLLLIIPSFAYGFNMAENTSMRLIAEQAYLKNSTAWGFAEKGMWNKAENDMRLALYFCDLYVNFPYGGRPDADFYKRVYFDCRKFNLYIIEFFKKENITYYWNDTAFFNSDEVCKMQKGEKTLTGTGDVGWEIVC